MIIRSITLLFFLFTLSNCSKNKHLFELMSGDNTGIDFVNSIQNADSLLLMSFEFLYNGGGVAVGDINNDGLKDIYFTGNLVSGKLYLNKGNMVFEDVTQTAGVSTSSWINGASMIDINLDGYLDIYLSAGGISNKNSKRSNLLFVNQKDGTFKEEAKTYGLDDNRYTQHTVFFDYDGDGDLDAYLLTTALDPYNWKEFKPIRKNGEASNNDRLYRNNGDNTFSDVSKEAGIRYEGYGLGIALCDINNDTWPDIYIANDFLSNDILYINQKDGTFINEIDNYLTHTSRNGMGADLQDINNDGFTDIMVLDMLPVSNIRQKTMFGFFDYDKHQRGINSGYMPQYARNTLQLNNGNGTFSEIGQLSGVDRTDWSWSVLCEDFDNDGNSDLFITNGYRLDVTNMDFATYSRQLTSSAIGTTAAKNKQMLEKLKQMPEIKLHNYMFKSKGDLTFQDVSIDWGMEEPSYSNGSSFADLDNDGDLDLIVNNIDHPAFLYKNNSNENKEKSNHYLRVDLSGPALNPTGIGAKVSVKTKKKLFSKFFSPYRGYISTVESTLHFGLGGEDEIVEIEVTWPDGKQQILNDVKVDQVLTLRYESAKIVKQVPIIEDKRLFEEVSDLLSIDFVHQEKDFVDFKVQPTIPHKHSELGPGIAVGDLNNDELDDFYIGGSAGFQGGVYLQNSVGGFTKSSSLDAAVYEDMGSLIFDANGDGFNDLYVVSGGSSRSPNSVEYQDRLYINDGSGQLIHAPEALPSMFSSGSTVIASDYDRDGDLDLFVGGRIVPGSYPMAAKSYLLRNDNEKGQVKFTDVATEIPGLKEVGLVTSALFSDYDNDGFQDLIVTGEWMPITIFKNTGNGFENRTVTSGLADTHGWWNSLTTGDFDNDGDIDFIAGNLGLNTPLRANETEPLCVYAKDFDGNGRIDPIMCYYLEGENYIAHSRDNLIEQISAMRVRFKTYTEYGNTPFSNSFTKAELSDAYITKSKTFASSYIENDGKGKFSIRPLPVLAQIAPMFGAIVDDFNDDGNLDFLMVGNSDAAEISVGNYDACKGLYMSGDGSGNFIFESNGTNGFTVDSDAKGAAILVDVSLSPVYLITSNNDRLKAFRSTQVFSGKVVKVRADDAYATIQYKNGKIRKQEFYYGSTYLSQSSRMLKIAEDVVSVNFYDFKGNSRTLDL